MEVSGSAAGSRRCGPEVSTGARRSLSGRCPFSSRRLEARALGVLCRLTAARAGLTSYIKAALRQAHYDLLPDGEGFFGAIEALPGVWADAATLEACRDGLREVPKEWIVPGCAMATTCPS